MKHRTGDVVVTVLGRDGTAMPNADVTVEQRRHAFAFGNIGFDLIPLANGGEPGARVKGLRWRDPAEPRATR